MKYLMCKYSTALQSDHHIFFTIFMVCYPKFSFGLRFFSQCMLMMMLRLPKLNRRELFTIINSCNSRRTLLHFLSFDSYTNTYCYFVAIGGYHYQSHSSIKFVKMKIFHCSQSIIYLSLKVYFDRVDKAQC